MYLENICFFNIFFHKVKYFVNVNLNEMLYNFFVEKFAMKNPGNLIENANCAKICILVFRRYSRSYFRTFSKILNSYISNFLKNISGFY